MFHCEENVPGLPKVWGCSVPCAFYNLSWCNVYVGVMKVNEWFAVSVGDFCISSGFVTNSKDAVLQILFMSIFLVEGGICGLFMVFAM